MSYDNPDNSDVSFAITTADLTRTIRNPKGKRARLRDILVHGTGTAFTATTTPARIRLGVAGDLARFADFTLGTLGASAALSASTVNGVKTLPRSSAMPEMPADTDIIFTYTAPTGGTPAGTGGATVMMNTY